MAFTWNIKQNILIEVTDDANDEDSKTTNEKSRITKPPGKSKLKYVLFFIYSVHKIFNISFSELSSII